MQRPGSLVVVSATLAALGCSEEFTGPVEQTAAAPLGAIAFASTRGGRWQWPEIYVADHDGSNVRRIAIGTSPAWSWDGQWIAFHRDENPYDRDGVYVARFDGSEERFVGGGVHPAWSPDGSIAVGRRGGIAVIAGGRDLTLVDWAWAGAHWDEGCDGGSYGPFADYPNWSPDGQRIAFSIGCSGRSRLYLMNADGSEPRPLSESGGIGPPAWSPDGSRIAAWIDGAITTVDVNSGAVQVHYRAVDQSPGLKVDWSPDGNRIAFTAAGPDSETRIFAVSLETGVVEQVVPVVWLSPGVQDYYEDFDVAWARSIQ